MRWMTSKLFVYFFFFIFCFLVLIFIVWTLNAATVIGGTGNATIRWICTGWCLTLILAPLSNVIAVTGLMILNIMAFSILCGAFENARVALQLRVKVDKLYSMAWPSNGFYCQTLKNWIGLKVGFKSRDNKLWACKYRLKFMLL